MSNTKALLDYVAGRNTGSVGAVVASAMDTFCPQYGINSPLRLAHFIAQACEETMGFKYLREIWGPTPAQTRYEGRVDLGNTHPGDGHLYLGRGIFDLTGRANYVRVGRALGIPLETQPELASDPTVAVRVACYYWQSHNISAMADADDIEKVTRAVNGGLNGFADRKMYYERAHKILLTPNTPLPPPPPPTAPTIVTTTVPALNLRTSPDPNAGIFCILPGNAQLTVLAEAGQYLQIQYGIWQGWVLKQWTKPL
jgi:putative chitinase